MGVRLTILGGYLGAGKTTLLNGLLGSAAGAKVAVVVNDFGSINIDRRLIRSETADTIDLTNGCICCTMRDGSAEVMASLAQRDLDHVVVEVSGVGDPQALASWGSFPGYSHGQTVVCVDSTAAGRLLTDDFVGDTVFRQLAAADLFVLTKTDLAGPAQSADSLLRCRAAAPAAHILFSEGGDITLAALLGVGGTSPEVQPPLQAPLQDPDRPALRSGDGSIHRQLTITLTAPVDAAALTQILNNLPASVARAKGIIRLRHSPQTRTVVQYSAGRLSLTDDGPWQEPEPGHLVFITAGGSAAAPDLTLIEERFRALSGSASTV